MTPLRLRRLEPANVTIFQTRDHAFYARVTHTNQIVRWSPQHGQIRLRDRTHLRTLRNARRLSIIARTAALHNVPDLNLTILE